MAHSYGNLVPCLWECMSADSWYSGQALSVGIRSKALTAYELWQFKVLQHKIVRKYGSKKLKISFQLRPQLEESDTILAVPAWNASSISYDRTVTIITVN